MSNGAQLDAQDNNGSTALHRAAYNGNTRLVKKLVAKGARIDVRDIEGCLPLDIARQRSYDNLFQYLVDLPHAGKTSAPRRPLQRHLSRQQAQPHALQTLHHLLLPLLSPPALRPLSLRLYPPLTQSPPPTSSATRSSSWPSRSWPPSSCSPGWSVRAT